MRDLIELPLHPTSNGHRRGALARDSRALSYQELMREDLAPPTPLCDPFLDAGGGALLAGPPNVGKSWLIAYLARAVASGTPWLGHFSTVAGTVLWLDAEATPYHVRERLRMLERAQPLGDDLPIHLVIGEGLRLDATAGFAHLDALMADLRPALVVADSLVRHHGADENAAGQMAEVFAAVRRLMLHHGSAFLFAHHARKAGPAGNDPADMLRGSTEIRAWPDTILFASPSTDGLTMSHVKSRYSARLPDFRLRLDITDDAAQIVYHGEIAASAETKTSDIVAAITALQTQFGPDGADVKHLVDQLGSNESTVRRQLTSLVKSGTIVTREIRTAGRPKAVYDVREPS